jgi:hypothetical protein
MTQRDASASPKPNRASESPEQPRAGEHERDRAGDETLQRRKRVEEGAYYRAERRGFAPGGELDDWYAAEADEGAGDGEETAPKPRGGV